MNRFGFTVVTLLTFAALPALAQDVDEDAEAEAIEEVVDDVIAPEVPPTVIGGDLPVTVPDPGAVPPVDAPRLDTPDAVFIADALRDGEMEIAAAELARDRGTSPGIRSLAETLAADHERLNDRLRALAAAGAATEPRGRPAHPEMASLQSLEDEAFDAAWLAVEEKHHREAIRKYERAAASPALDVQLRSLADEALTTLQAHADAVSDLRDSLGFD